MAWKIFKRQEREFYKNYHPITKYFQPIQKSHAKTTKKTQEHISQDINKIEVTQNKKQQTKIVKYIARKITVEPMDAPT